eukprot:1524458-Rhodomonas_salina.2
MAKRLAGRQAGPRRWTEQDRDSDIRSAACHSSPTRWGVNTNMYFCHLYAARKRRLAVFLLRSPARA